VSLKTACVLIVLVALAVACRPRAASTPKQQPSVAAHTAAATATPLAAQTPTVTSTPLPRPTATPTAVPTPMPNLTPYSTVTASGQAWTLIWADEFDYDGLPDRARWDYETGYVRNDELQYYTYAREKNARVRGGMLVIEAHKESYKGYNYTSASLVTQDRASWRYGRVEVRAKLPTGNGTWPAIWMLGVNIPRVGWPDCGEIDIMENVGFDPDLIHGNIHTQAYNHVKRTNKGASVTVAQPYEVFHVYAIEWFEDRIDFFIDEAKYFTFRNEGTGWETWPYDQEFYLILNLAIGGSWGGMRGVDDGILPQQYYIDYVRVYKAAG
jgi:beta-glucanase (GH16 family)